MTASAELPEQSADDYTGRRRIVIKSESQKGRVH